MRIGLFGKSFLVLLMLSLAAFVLMEIEFMALLKMLAGALLLSIAFAVAYPELRGVRSGDTVMVISSDSPLVLLGRFGVAIEGGKKNSTIKIRLNDGNEIVGTVESYAGLITPPKVKVVYEERLVERWKY